MSKKKRQKAAGKRPARTGKKHRAEISADAVTRRAVAAEVDDAKAAVTEAKQRLDAAKTEADLLRKQAAELEAEAKHGYASALAPYRLACRRAGAKCEFEGVRAAPKVEMVRFLVERCKQGVKVMIKDRPKTETILPMKQLRQSVGKAALAFTTKHLGPPEEIGAKDRGLANRIRALLR